MASIKTAVSIPQPLFREVEELAGKLGVSRSRLYARALADYLEHHENEQLLEQINSAYGYLPDIDEKELFGRMKRYHAKLTEEE